MTSVNKRRNKNIIWKSWGKAEFTTKVETSSFHKILCAQEDILGSCNNSCFFNFDEKVEAFYEQSQIDEKHAK